MNNQRAHPADLDIDPTTLLRRGLYLEGHGIPETHKSLHLAKESSAHVWTTQLLGGDTLLTYGEPTGIISGYDGSIWLATTRWQTYASLYKQLHVWHTSAQGQFTSQLILEASFLDRLAMSMDALTDAPVMSVVAWGGTDYRYLLFLQRTTLGPWGYDVVDSTMFQDFIIAVSVRTDVEGEQAIAYVVNHYAESGMYIGSELKYAHRAPPEVGTRPFIVETIAQSDAAMGGIPYYIRLTVDQDGGPLVVMPVYDPTLGTADIWEAHRSVSGVAVSGGALVQAPSLLRHQAWPCAGKTFV